MPYPKCWNFPMFCRKSCRLHWFATCRCNTPMRTIYRKWGMLNRFANLNLLSTLNCYRYCATTRWFSMCCWNWNKYQDLYLWTQKPP